MKRRRADVVPGVGLMPRHASHKFAQCNKPRHLCTYPAASIGLVVEPKRYESNPNDAFEWYALSAEISSIVTR
jgi:hypothetical protein